MIVIGCVIFLIMAAVSCFQFFCCLNDCFDHFHILCIKCTHCVTALLSFQQHVILVGGRQPACLVCLASRRLSSVKNSEGLAGWSGALSARQRTQTYWRMSRTITRQTAAQSGPQACVPLSTDAKGSTARSKKTPGQLWPGEDGVVGFGGGLGRCQGYEVRSHWISCSYKIAPAEGKVCRTLSRRNFFPHAATLLAIGYIY